MLACIHRADQNNLWFYWILSSIFIQRGKTGKKMMNSCVNAGLTLTSWDCEIRNTTTSKFFLFMNQLTDYGMQLAW